jgi:hypothetical protein
MRNIVVAVALVLAATAVFAAARQDIKPTMPMMLGMIQNSPMNIQGVEVTVTDTPQGATISFTTKTGDVAELRRLVRRHVEMMKNMHMRMNSTNQPEKK